MGPERLAGPVTDRNPSPAECLMKASDPVAEMPPWPTSSRNRASTTSTSRASRSVRSTASRRIGGRPQVLHRSDGCIDCGSARPPARQRDLPGGSAARRLRWVDATWYSDPEAARAVVDEFCPRPGDGTTTRRVPSWWCRQAPPPPLPPPVARVPIAATPNATSRPDRSTPSIARFGSVRMTASRLRAGPVPPLDCRSTGACSSVPIRPRRGAPATSRIPHPARADGRLHAPPDLPVGARFGSGGRRACYDKPDDQRDHLFVATGTASPRSCRCSRRCSRAADPGTAANAVVVGVSSSGNSLPRARAWLGRPPRRLRPRDLPARPPRECRLERRGRAAGCDPRCAVRGARARSAGDRRLPVRQPGDDRRRGADPGRPRLPARGDRQRTLLAGSAGRDDPHRAGDTRPDDAAVTVRVIEWPDSYPYV